MIPTRRRNFLILAATLVVLMSVSYFGTVASFERAVYISSVDKILPDLRTESIEPLPTFISRPHQCNFRDIYVDRPIDPILQFLNDANDEGTRPISLMAASQLVPVVPWEDNLKVFNAGYLGIGEADLVFVSRVGFDRFYTRAAVCLSRAHAPHGFGNILLLERDGLDWSVVSIRVSSRKE